jgi:hypothetical protein
MDSAFQMRLKTDAGPMATDSVAATERAVREALGRPWRGPPCCPWEGAWRGKGQRPRGQSGPVQSTAAQTGWGRGHAAEAAQQVQGPEFKPQHRRRNVCRKKLRPCGGGERPEPRGPCQASQRTPRRRPSRGLTRPAQLSSRPAWLLLTGQLPSQSCTPGAGRPRHVTSIQSLRRSGSRTMGRPGFCDTWPSLQGHTVRFNYGNGRPDVSEPHNPVGKKLRNALRISNPSLSRAMSNHPLTFR